jgi:putative ABC transport system permease protein
MESGNYGNNMAIRIDTKNIPTLINQIKNKWQSMAPDLTFNYTFMDNDFNNLYHAEQKTGKLFITFAAFAIFIACLGLFGLVTYAAEQRTKEIGIRKVLGAGVGRIVTMLSKEFVKLVLIASLIGFPLAWWAMNQWLQSFAYRINISWWVFVIAGRAAMANPVKSLRAE